VQQALGEARSSYLKKESAIQAAITKLENDQVAVVMKAAMKLGIDVNSKERAYNFDASTFSFKRTK
jgi:hypothetical protein